MTGQPLTLFEPPDDPPPGTPRCGMCARPARWLRTRAEWARYCAGASCTNRERLCQLCAAPFHVGLDGAGNKYCSPGCKHDAYRLGRRRPVEAIACAWCTASAPVGTKLRPDATWPYICQTCVHPIRHLLGRLKDHHVSHELARKLVDDPGCHVCGLDIVAKVRNATSGKVRALLVVDHDHGCCPGEKSCGACVRGLLCGGCNSAAGMLGEDPARAAALAAYLRRA